MPTINYSVTQSIDTLAVNLSASEALVMNINNPLVGASYFGLETIPNSDGIYTSASPKNTSGSFTMGTGILGVIKDDYKMSAVVSPGDNVLTFTPASDVTGSTLRTRGITSPPISGFDADALAFFTRVATAGGTLSTTEQVAVNQLVLDMKSANIWNVMKAVYPMVGASAAACAQNLKSSSFTGTFTSGWTFASTGVTPNGTSAYMDPSFNPSLQLTNSSGHFSYYSRSNTAAGNKYEIGCYDGTFGNGVLVNNGNINYAVYGAYNATTTNTDSRGFYLTNRNSSTNTTGFKNGTKVINAISTGFAANKLIFIGAENSTGGASGFTDRECAFASLGDGLTDTQASNFYTAVQAFQTTLGRQV